MSLKYSILLPTRNGGEYLENCINAVLNQNYDNLELIVSDNANTDETQEILERYSADDRVVSLRLEETVSVTENWNNALKAVSGDYIAMLGDDDLLLPYYIEKINSIIEEQGKPDCITYNAFGYISPGAIANNSESYYSKSFFSYSDLFNNPRFLSREERLQIVKDMYQFKVNLPLNMQTTIMSAKAIEKIEEGIFQAPFPDHYALNSLLINSSSWYFTPEKMLVIGVSPKSFGHYVYSNEQKKGKSYLGLNEKDDSLLPGNELLNNMCIWLKLVKKNNVEELGGISIKREAYLARQIFWWLKELKTGGINVSEFIDRCKLIKPGEFLKIIKILFESRTWKKILSVLKSKKDRNINANIEGMNEIKGISNIHEFSVWLQKH